MVGKSDVGFDSELKRLEYKLPLFNETLLKNHKKILDNQAVGTTTFLDTTVEFQRKMMPYSDKGNLIAAILFYENTLKSLHEFNELNEM